MTASDTVGVGPFEVANLAYDEAVDMAAQLAVAPEGPNRFYALHVGGLNARHEQAFVDEMNAAELVCADGGSVVLLARLSGARSIERVPTTDAGWDVLRGVGNRLGRPARIALVGGSPGLADRAASALRDGHAGEVVLVESGYHQDWSDVLSRLRTSRPDVCIIGMGAPREMLWVGAHLDQLPPSLVMTCGGWFGFLAGDEHRAPKLLRRPGLEWLGRVTNCPVRLLPRYARGLGTVALLTAQGLVSRVRRV